MQKMIASALAGSLIGILSLTTSAQTALDWQADLQFMFEGMQSQHPALFRRTSKADFEKEIKELRDRIPSANEDEIVVGLMKIVAMVHDGHTGLFPAERFKSGVFPLRFYKFEDGLFIRQAAPPYAEYVGAKVTRVGGLSTEEAYQRAASIVGADNQMGVSENAPILLAVPELLHGLGVITSKASLPLTVEVNGKTRDTAVTPAFTFRDLLRPPADWADMAGSTPLYRQHPGDTFWYEHIKEKRVLYVQQNAVANKPDETLSKFYERALSYAAANGVERVVIDLRMNDGGNNGLNRAVIRSLIKSRFDEPGKLFVITGRATFSAAQNLLTSLKSIQMLSSLVSQQPGGRITMATAGR